MRWQTVRRNSAVPKGNPGFRLAKNPGNGRGIIKKKTMSGWAIEGDIASFGCWEGGGAATAGGP